MSPLSPGDDLWFDLLPCGAVVQDAQWAVVRANAAATPWLALVERGTILRCEDRSSLPEHEHPVARALTGQSPSVAVVAGVGPELAYRWFRVSSRPWTSPHDPNARFAVTTIEEVTQQKVGEDSRRLDRELLFNGPVVIVETRGLPPRVVGTSSNFHRVFGLGAAPPRGADDSLRSWVHPDDYAAFLSAWTHETSTAKSESLTGRFRFRDGVDHWREVSYQATVDRRGPEREPTALMYLTDRTAEAENLWRLALTLKAARTGTWDWSLEHDRVQVDAEWANLIGGNPADFSDLTLDDWRALVHPADVPAWDKTTESVGAGEQVAFDVDLRLRHRNDQWVWIRIRGKVLEADADGRPLRVLGTQEDISDVVLAEEERSILSQVVEQGPSAVLLTDLSGTIEYVNRQFTSMTGYTLNEVQGKNPRILKSPNTSSDVYAELWTTIRAGRPWFGEFQNRRKDGTHYWVQASISPISDNTGSVYRYVGQHIDITARKQVEEASRAQYRFQLFLTQAAALLVNVRGESVAQAMTEILRDLALLFRADRVFFGFLTGGGPTFNVRHGWARLGDSLPTALSFDDAPLWRKRVQDREPLLSAGVPCPVPWSPRPVAALIAVPLLGGYGDPGYLVLDASTTRADWNTEVQVSVTVVANTLSAFMRRVTDELELKAARREAEQANQAKSDFLAHMSHEIRTPMNGILGLAELALAEQLPSEAKSWLEGIKASGETLLSLVNDILDVSKIEAGKLELEVTSFSLADLVRATVATLQVLAGKKGLELSVDYQADLEGQREGDPTRLRQVLTNLVGNAIKFTAHGRVTVVVSRGGGDHRVLVTVRDTGPGVAADRVGRLFQRYSQADSSTNRKFGGTGLGLAICRELVERMGGSIGYQDARPGPGGEFWFEVPLDILGDPVIDAQADHGLNQVRPKRALRVLVVEDNVVNQQVAYGLLVRQGVTPVVASSGLEALEALMKGTFDLVLMDIQMPILDGLTTTRSIRRGEGGEPHRHVPIVAMTANAMQGDREASIEAGMDDYITKPISAAKIAELLEKWDRPKPALGADDRSRRTFDPHEMRERLQLEDEYLRQIVQLFLDDLPARRRAIQEAITEGRTDVLLRLAHTLKGTAANLVAQGVVEVSQAVETAALEGRADQTLALVKDLTQEIDLLERALTEFLR